METIIKEINLDTKVEDIVEIVECAGNILKKGGLVAFPTETVYGLGANALDPVSSMKIYEAKGRPSDNPLIVHISNIKDIEVIANNIPESCYKLAEKFWPGPLTMILEKTTLVPFETTGGLNTIAIRIPKNKVALEIIEAGGGFIAAPSANSSGKPSPTKAAHVIEDLNGKIDMVIDYGSCQLGLESTIIDLSIEKPTILRPGFITAEEISEVIGPIYDNTSNKIIDDKSSPKAPGMKYKHYAPKAELSIFIGRQDSVAAKINALIDECSQNNQTVGVLCSEETSHSYDNRALIKPIGSFYEENQIAASLYSSLREFDDDGVDIIFSESFYTKKLGDTIMNRLNKASGGKIFICQSIIDYSKYSQIIFVDDFDIQISSMAKYILRSLINDHSIRVESRGISVSFREPLMPKVDIILAKHGIDASKHKSSLFDISCLCDDALIIAMNTKTRDYIIENFKKNDNVYILSDVINENIEIDDPFGKDISEYEKCYNKLKHYLDMLAQLLRGSI